MRKEEMFDVLGGLPDDMVLHAESKSATAQAGDTRTSRAARREARREKWRLITTNNWFVAAVSLVVAFGVLFAIVQAGRLGGSRTPVTPAAAGRACIEVLKPTEEDKSAAAQAPAASAAGRLGIKSYHGMGKNDTCTLTFTSNGNGTCTLTDIDVNLLYEKPFTLTIPDKSPAGDIVTAIDTDGLNGVPLILTEGDFTAMTDTLAAGMPEGRVNFYYKKLLAYYGGETGGISVSRAGSEDELRELLNVYPIAAAADLRAFDPNAAGPERAAVAAILYRYAPAIDAVTQYGYLLHLKDIADRNGTDAPADPDDFRADGRYVRAVVLPKTVRRVNRAAFGGCFNMTELRTDMTREELLSVRWCETHSEVKTPTEDEETSVWAVVTEEYGLSLWAMQGSRGDEGWTQIRVICADGTLELTAYQEDGIVTP